MVLSELTGEVALRRVVRTFVHPDRRLVEVVVSSPTGAEQQLRVTPNHPLWTEDGWVEASRLRAGQRLLDPSGEWSTVVEVVDSGETATVHNFEVEEFHTYFVGAVGVVVHNMSWVGVGDGVGSAAGGSGTAIQPFYPPNNGFLGESTKRFLYAGERIDRYGGSGFSRFFSPAGTPAGARALPPGTAGQPLRTSEVVKPFEVEAGTVAPAFGELGLGTQFRTPVRLETLLKRGVRREVTP
ncbi:MAG: glycohydrolase toxin TNT-related protein [Myxococcales bacterium]|nr:glycohydrolase toxin TNT-related protein [Myxococcales bacterium]MCB9520382.1 glycohydrolase toxin TNT-related protein [Myxococcales bacterium]